MSSCSKETVGTEIRTQAVGVIEMPVEMDHEMQMVWQTAWHDQSVVRHKARFKAQQPVSCEAAAWSAVVALIKGRAKVSARAAISKSTSANAGEK